MDYGRRRATWTGVALILLALDVAASDAIAASDIRQLIGRKCDRLESVLGRPREITRRVDQGPRGDGTTVEVRTYDNATVLCTDGRITSVRSVEPRKPVPGRPGSPAMPARVPSAPPGPVVGTKPRLSQDRRTLVLLEEVREPGAPRQPEIALKVDATTGARLITVGARGMTRLSKIRIGCEAGPRELTLSAFSQTPDRNTATFMVPGELATAVLTASSCYLSVAGALIPLPRDLLPPVWESRRHERRGEPSTHMSSEGDPGHPAYGQVRYVDEHGVAHWVPSLEQVPERYQEQVFEQKMANNPFFEPIVRAQDSGPSPPLKWELVRRDFEDSGKRLTRHVLREQLSAPECLGLMRSIAESDPVAASSRSVTAKGGYGIGLVRRGYRDVPVKAWQCVAQR